MNKEQQDAFIEKGAALEHARWSRWQEHCHRVLRELCPSFELEKVLARWDRQIKTPYELLSDSEKESDRREVREYLPLLADILVDARKDNASVGVATNMWRSGDNVYMTLSGEDYLFRISDILALPDLAV